ICESRLELSPEELLSAASPGNGDRSWPSGDFEVGRVPGASPGKGGRSYSSGFCVCDPLAAGVGVGVARGWMWGLSSGLSCAELGCTTRKTHPKTSDKRI